MIGKRYEYDAMANCEKDLWWYKNLHALTLHYIQQYSNVETPSILDAACGTGGMLTFLKEHGFSNLTGFDLSSDAVEYAREKTGLPILESNILDAEKLFPEKKFDIIICNDIFCLLPPPQDKIALNGLYNLLKPGGILLFNIAALNAFRGTHDICVDMVMRYNKKDIQHITPAGAAILKMRYWPFLLSPLVFSIRAVQRLQIALAPKKTYESDVKMIPSLPNQLFHALTQMEFSLLPNAPWGSSLYTVMKKK